VLDTLACLDRAVNTRDGDWVPSDVILLDDWEALADLLPSGYTEDAVDHILSRQWEELLPTATAEAGAAEKSKKGKAPGNKGFLFAGLGDEQLLQLVEAIKRAGCPPFVRLKLTLEIRKSDGKALSQIISHVVAWVNPRPSDVKRTGNNKPPLCKDLEPAFRAVHSGAAAAEIEQMSIQLERDVLERALSRLEELDRLTSGLTLGEFLAGDESGSAAYGSRFVHDGLWRDILEIVRRTLGPGIHPEWATSEQQGYDAGEAGDQSQEVTIERGVMTLVEQISSIREINRNVWAGDRAPFTRLKQMLEQTIEKWLAEEDSNTRNSSIQHRPSEMPRDRLPDENRGPVISRDEDRSVDVDMDVDANGDGKGAGGKERGLGNIHLSPQGEPNAAVIWNPITRTGELSHRGSIRSSPHPLEMYKIPHADHHAARMNIPSSLDGGGDTDELVVLPPLRNIGTEALWSSSRTHYNIAPKATAKATTTKPTPRTSRRKLPDWATKGPVAR
jgi:hypothetical protein